MVDSPTDPDRHSGTKPDSFVIDDPATLRAIAHPIRQQILSALGVSEFARAADLAQLLGEPANSISFHLRTLAKAGLIVEAPELARDRRDRVWRRVAGRLEIRRKMPGTMAVLAPMLDWLHETLESEADESVYQAFSAGPAMLTKDEAKEMGAELEAVLERWQERTVKSGRQDEPEPERIHYQVLFALGPRWLGRSPSPGSSPDTTAPTA
jgi:DNA-binding transcriptional ArsR family regulator